MNWLRRLACRLFGHRWELTNGRVVAMHGNWRLWSCTRCRLGRLTSRGPDQHHNCRCSIDALHEA